MLRHILFPVLMTISLNALATGMVPETSILLVDEKRGEASMNVKNTDDHPALLYTTVVDLPESNKSIRLIPTQPVVRVEAGQVQQVRFLLQTPTPLISEEFKRVTFEGIPPKDDNSSKVTVSIRQDLPVLIHPTSLAEEREAWKFLKWRKTGNQIEVSNPSDYVVRMTLQFKTLPSGKAGALSKTYLLPHTRTTSALTNMTDTSVEFYPASRYGYRGKKYITDLN
ncbi:fimbria/pilus chaperone family protein [Escherichia albertii]|uniref:fimbria/pilus chaperone family protein n=1 Tax=Escherichia albertii TaxID=208962 RepID=UPI000BF52315|nr:fimbria/pilus chaperone family protein [Escherichia albertii]PFF96445.1 fimbrial chaperone protein [Escherichia albertii]WDC35022.1 fimbria/pilus chaperone family protein [Escherichia albertii]